MPRVGELEEEKLLKKDINKCHTAYERDLRTLQRDNAFLRQEALRCDNEYKKALKTKTEMEAKVATLQQSIREWEQLCESVTPKTSEEDSEEDSETESVEEPRDEERPRKVRKIEAKTG